MNESQLSTGGGAAVSGNVQTGRDFIGRDQIIINLVQGMADLPTHYDGPVRNFLSYYLGSEIAPAPFGGRDDDLARLDRWLVDPQAAHYLLLAAPAGRGKSALLAHWVTGLIHRQAVHVVFFPISIRFSTNRENVVFAALAARLARIYGEKLTPAIDAQQYRGVVSDYLQRTPPDGKPLLVVLDGLDEAAGWQTGADLFPLQPPTHLRVIVATRLRANDPAGEGWLTQLGWENGQGTRFSLVGLDRASVADVLEKMGNPLDVLAAKIDVVTKLHELSEGDPLLVRLYVEALLPHGSQMAAFAPADLLSLKPGLKAFFDRWFDEQKKLWNAAGLATVVRDSAVNGLLNLCALAKGPLSRDDLLALASNELPNGATIEWAAETLNRFIIGDGSSENGYTFGHPRFGYYFAERLPTQERKSWSERFFAYGHQMLTDLENKILEPKNASPYAVRYYGAHLVEAKAPPANFYALVCESWLRAWEWIDGTPDGFLSDANLVLAVAKVEGPTALGQIVRTALCFSSITSLGANIPTKLMTTCVKTGVISPQLALVLTRAQPKMKDRAVALSEIAAIEPLSPELRQSMFAEALAIARSTLDNWKRADTLSCIVAYSPSDQQATVFAEALAAARSIDDPGDHDSAINNVIEHLPPHATDLLADALAAICSIYKEWRRVEALSRVIKYLPSHATDLFASVLDIAQTLYDERSRANMLNHLIERLPSHESNLLAEILTIAHNIKDTESYADVLIRVAEYLPPDQQANMFAEALTIVRTISHVGKRAEALSRVAEQLPPNQQGSVFTEALALAHTIDSGWMRTETISNVLKHLTPYSRDLLVEALAFARSTASNWRCADILSRVVECLSLDATELLTDVLTIARSIDAPGQRADVLICAAKRFPSYAKDLLAEAIAINIDLGRVEALIRTVEYLPSYASNLFIDAIAAARTIEHNLTRANALICIAKHLSLEQKAIVLVDILATVRAIDNAATRAEVLSRVADYFFLSQATDLLNALANALIDARKICDIENRTDVLICLAEHLPLDQRSSIFVEALATAYTINDAEKRAKTLSRIAEHLTAEQRTTVLNNALTAARIIEDKGQHAKTLSYIAQHLPPDQQAAVLTDVFALVRTIDDQRRCAEVLSHVVEHLSPKQPASVLADVLAMAQTIEDDGRRAKFLSLVAQHLPFAQQTTVFIDAIDTASGISDVDSRADALIDVIEYLTPSQQVTVLTDTLAAAHTINDDWRRTEILNYVVERLPTDQQAAVRATELASARTINHDQIRADLLRRFAQRLQLSDQELTDRGDDLVDTRIVDDYEKCADALSRLAQRLPPDQQVAMLADALAVAHCLIYVEGSRVDTLSRVAERLPSHATGLQWQLLLDACNLCHVSGSPSILSALTPHWTELCRANGLSEINEVTRVLRAFSASQRENLLGAIEALLPVIARLGGERAVRETARAILDTARWWP